MRYYMDYSARIYKIYLKYVAPEDIHVYSIDEVFIDATAYLKLYKLDARSFAKKLVLEVLAHTGITATAGVGTNLYLAGRSGHRQEIGAPGHLYHGGHCAPVSASGALWRTEPL